MTASWHEQRASRDMSRAPQASSRAPKASSRAPKVAPHTSRQAPAARLRRWLAAGIAGAIALSLSSCGIPVGDEPAAIARQNVPFGLLRPATSTPASSSTAPFPPNDHVIQIFLVNPAGDLVAVDRLVPEPVDLTTILQALIDGPTSSESAAGLEDQVPAQTRVLTPGTVAGAVATVDLSAAFGQLAGQAQIEAIAQVVFTVTADVPGVSEVAFEVNGQQTSVPEPDGALVNDATRADYHSLLPA